MRRYPVNGQPIITNKYRANKYSPHYGEDLAVPKRTAVFSLTNGVVIEVKNDETRQWLANTNSDPYKPLGFPLIKRSLRTADYGNYIKIDHGSGVHTLYAHLDSTEVFKGQTVVEGELIGYADSTGNSTGNHVHFEIRVNNKVVDPDKFDYSFKGVGGTDSTFTKYEGAVDIRKDVSALYVRSKPSTTSSLSGSRELKGGTKGIKVKGFVEGEEIGYNLGTKEKPIYVKTNLWWVSQFGNFFWSGGTVPSAESVINVKQKGKKMTPEEVQKIDADIANTEARIAELKAEIEELESQKVEMVSKKESTPVVEPVEEEVVAEETPAEEVPAVEETPVDENADAIAAIKDMMEKHGISVEQL